MDELYVKKHLTVKNIRTFPHENGVDITWDPMSNAKKFTVRLTGPGTLLNFTTNTTHFFHDDLTPETEYTAVITPVGTSLENFQSKIVTFTTSLDTAPVLQTPEKVLPCTHCKTDNDCQNCPDFPVCENAQMCVACRTNELIHENSLCYPHGLVCASAKVGSTVTSHCTTCEDDTNCIVYYGDDYECDQGKCVPIKQTSFDWILVLKIVGLLILALLIILVLFYFARKTYESHYSLN